MSKISDENLTLQVIRGYWKRFAALGTAFADKYRFDPFFRAEANTICLQAAFAVLIFILVGISFTYIYQDISLALINHVQKSVRTGETVLPDSSLILLEELGRVQISDIVVVAVVAVLIIALFGYLIGRVTLSPARTALNSQKQFIGNIAHELRTPLAIMKTNTEIALLDESMGNQFKKFLQSNVEELNRASDIINNLLSLNSFIRPEQMVFEDVDLGKIVGSVVRDLLPLATNKHIAVVVRRASRRGDYSIVWGNPTALDQIVRNLLKNSISYTPTRGNIHVTIEPVEAHHVRLTIEDTGIGIGRKDLFRIFEPFYRADQSRNREQGGGSGLGLAIVSELVKLHHGRISVRSTQGSGTTVMVLFHAGAHPSPEKERTGKDLQGFNEISVDFSAHKAPHRKTRPQQENLL